MPASGNAADRSSTLAHRNRGFEAESATFAVRWGLTSAGMFWAPPPVEFRLHPKRRVVGATTGLRPPRDSLADGAQEDGNLDRGLRFTRLSSERLPIVGLARSPGERGAREGPFDRKGRSDEFE